MLRRSPTTMAIIGASVAGLDVAAEAAARGHKVTVYERAPTLGLVDRTLIVTPRVQEFLGPMLDRVTVNKVKRYELFADGVSTSVALERPDVVIERSILIRELAKHATLAGAKIMTGRRFVGLAPHPRGVEVRIDGLGVSVADTVVAADGVNSVVARAAGWPSFRTVPLVQAVIETPSDLAPDTARVWFRPHESPYFYWLIPEGPRRSVLGLIGEHAGSTRRHLEGFLGELRLTAIEYQAARVPTYRGWVQPHRTVGSGEVLLVGDAACHVKVSTVGGIHTGFRGSRAIASASRRELRRLRRELDRHLRVRRVLHQFNEDSYRRLITSLGAGSRRILARHTRDDSRALLRTLLIREPRIALLAARTLIARGRREPWPNASQFSEPPRVST